MCHSTMLNGLEIYDFRVNLKLNESCITQDTIIKTSVLILIITALLPEAYIYVSLIINPVNVDH